MHRWAALAVLAAAASACGSAPVNAPTTAKGPAAPGAPSASGKAADSVLPGPSPHRVALGEVRETPLVITEILSEQGSDSALAVHQFAGDDLGYVQRIDGTSRTLGPVIVLEREPVLASFAHGDSFILATTHDGSVCLTTYRERAVESRGCELKQGDALVPFGDGFISVWSEPLEEAVEKRAARKPDAKREPPKEPAPRPKKKPGKGKGEPKVAASPKKLAVVRQLVKADGTLDGDDEVTDLTFTSPMAGMGIVDATSSGSRARILFYEYTGAAKNRPKQVIGKSRLALGSLDEHGAYDSASRKSFPDSDLMFGFLPDHQDPRVIPTSRGALYLGLTSSHGKCEAAVVSPFFMQMIPNDDLCAYEPSMFFDIATSVRDAQKAGSNGGKSAMPEAPQVDAVLKSAHRAFGQPSYDLPHAAIFGEHAYSLVAGEGGSGDKVVRFTDPTKIEEMPRPLVASRLRIAWGAFAPDGSGVAAVDGHVVTVSASGEVKDGPAVDASLSLFDRPDVASVERSLVTKVGDTFYQSRGAIRQIAPAFDKEPILKLLPDADVLVGGEHAGLILGVSGPTFSIRRFEPSKAPVSVARIKSPILVGFDAVPRKGGGALVAGPKRGEPTRVVTFAIDADGKVTDTTDTGFSVARENPSVRLLPLPSGGALLMDPSRARVVWLDDDAHVVSAAGWPGGTSGARCIDGRSAPTEVPTPTPGVFKHVDDLATEGACITGDFAWGPDGSLRWFGSTSLPPHARAELGLIPKLTEPVIATNPVAQFNAPPAVTDSPCPGDMVSVEGRYCVDRYESTLADANGRFLSPDYSATESYMSVALAEWST